MISEKELVAIRERHQPIHRGPSELDFACERDDWYWPCDSAVLLAHIDAITEAVAADALWHDFKVEGADPDLVEEIRAAVLAILRGTP